MVDDPLEPAEANRQLRELLKRVPADYSTWGIERTREYKDAAREARILIDKRSMRGDFLNKALKKLKVFYR